MYGRENWTTKKADHWRIDAFELWCWRRLLRVLWTARSSSQSWRKSILNIHWKDWCWSWSSNTLATWCEEPTHWKKILLLGKTEGKRKRWLHRMRCLDRITDSMDMNLSKLWEIVEDRGACRVAVHGITKTQTWLSNWITTSYSPSCSLCISLTGLLVLQTASPAPASGPLHRLLRMLFPQIAAELPSSSPPSQLKCHLLSEACCCCCCY